MFFANTRGNTNANSYLAQMRFFFFPSYFYFVTLEENFSHRAQSSKWEKVTVYLEMGHRGLRNGKTGNLGKELIIFATKNRNQSLVDQFTPGIECLKRERFRKGEEERASEIYGKGKLRKHTWESILNIKK